MGIWGRLPHWHWGGNLRAGFVCLKQPLRCIVSFFCCPHGVLVLGLLGPFGESEVCPSPVGSVVLKQMGLFSPARFGGILFAAPANLWSLLWELVLREDGRAILSRSSANQQQSCKPYVGRVHVFILARMHAKSGWKWDKEDPILHRLLLVLVAAGLFYTTGALKQKNSFCYFQIPCLGSQA